MTWQDGFRLVNLGELARQMRCKHCCQLLDLSQTQSEIHHQLASVLHVICLCGTMTEVHTSGREQHSQEGAEAYVINIRASIVEKLYGISINHVIGLLHDVAHITLAHTQAWSYCLPKPKGTQPNSGDLSCEEDPNDLADLGYLCENSTDSISKKVRDHVVNIHDDKVTEMELNGPKITTTSMATTDNDGIGEVYHLSVPVVMNRGKIDKTATSEGAGDFYLPQDEKSSQSKEIDPREDLILYGISEESGTTNRLLTANCLSMEDVSKQLNPHQMVDNSSIPCLLLQDKSFKKFDASQLQVVKTVKKQQLKSDGCLKLIISKNSDHLPKIVYNSVQDVHQSECKRKRYKKTSTRERIRNKKRSLSSVSKQVLEERPYKCTDCVACFKYRSNLVNHERIHSGARPFVCFDCGAAFAQAGTLLEHRRRHTGQKPYMCELCAATFTRSNDMKKHKRVHSGERPYQCKECNRSFTQSSHLQQHSRTHSGMKPYVCDRCGKRFSQAASLLVHKMTHMADKQYSCPSCPKQFTSNSNMRAHLRKSCMSQRRKLNETPLVV